MRISILAVALVTLFASMAIYFREPPKPLPLSAFDPSWREELLANRERLENVPQVVSKAKTRDGFSVTIKNTGTSTLLYYGTGRTHVQLFREIFESNQWIESHWDWCGMGKEYYELKPGETVTMQGRFWKAEQPQRMLTNFSEKGTLRSGFVVLASEEEFEKRAGDLIR